MGVRVDILRSRSDSEPESLEICRLRSRAQNNRVAFLTRMFMFDILLFSGMAHFILGIVYLLKEGKDNLFSFGQSLVSRAYTIVIFHRIQLPVISFSLNTDAD